ALRGYGPLAEPAVAKLIELLDDPHMATMAANALGEIGPAARQAIPRLITALRQEHSLARADYASALGKFGNDAKEAIPDILPLIQDPHPDVRKTAETAVRSIDPQALPPAAQG